MEPLQMRCKIVQSGEVVEMYFYKVAITCGKKREYEIVKNSSEEKVKRLGNLYRARQNIRRIVWCNQSKYTKFVTLTYANTVLDINKVRRDITTFVQNMRRLGYDMRYLYVLENQKERGKKENNEGCIHVHMLIFIDKFIERKHLEKSWKHGFIGIEKIDNVRNLGAYVCKYITKENIADFGKRCYSCSIGLNRAEEERYYTLRFSDSGLELTPEEILNNLDVNYHSTVNYDFVDFKDDFATQSVSYFQGTWKEHNLIKEELSLNDLKRQIDSLLL